MTRTKLVKPRLVSVGLVADGEIDRTPLWQKAGSEAFVAPENIGPTTATTPWSSMSFWAAVGPWSGEPMSSLSTSWIWYGSALDLLAASMATFMPSRALMPSCWLSPDSGPWKPTLIVPPDGLP